jgi:hypothetical protein
MKWSQNFSLEVFLVDWCCRPVGSDTHDTWEEMTQCCYKQCKMGTGTSTDIDSALYVYLHTVCSQLFGNVTWWYDPIQLTSGNNGILPLPAARSVLSTSYWFADPRRIENQRDKRPWTTGSPPDCGAQLGSEGCLPPLLHLSHSVRALFSVFFSWPLLL